MLVVSQSSPLVFVVDTSALIGRIQYAAEELQLVTTPLIVQEMERKGLGDVVQMLLDTQKLRIIEPKKGCIQKVEKAASALGDLQYLSKPDQQLLALALDLIEQDFQAVVVTDDYSIQNVAQCLHIEFRPVSQRRIRDVIQWETYCSACNRSFPDAARGEVCPICATPLKRRARRKHRLAD